MKTTNQIDREANERKAKEIAEHSAYLSDFPRDKKSVMYGALEAMEWKDKQHAQEKQQLIDEACKWLFINDSYAIPTNVQVDRLREHLNKMKGE